MAWAAHRPRAPCRLMATTSAAWSPGRADRKPASGSIAETTDLPTRLIKSVVTDDQGRYLLPDLPKANYDVWVRGYGLVDSPKVKAAPGKAAASDGGCRRRARERRRSTIRRSTGSSLLQVPPKSDFPGTGPTGNGISPNVQEPGRVDPQHRQHRRLHRLPSDGQQGDARDSREPRHVRALASRRGIAAIQSGQAGGGMSARFTQVGRPARAGDVGGLDRSHCRRRAAGGGAAPAAGPRAQRRRHDVGLGRSEGVPPRRDRERQAQSDGERERTDLRRARGQRRLHAGRRSDAHMRRRR